LAVEEAKTFIEQYQDYPRVKTQAGKARFGLENHKVQSMARWRNRKRVRQCRRQQEREFDLMPISTSFAKISTTRSRVLIWRTLIHTLTESKT